MIGPILVFGAGGQFGQEMIALSANRGISVAGYTRAEADITSDNSVDAAILATNPRLVLNAAAYTAVDRAESEPDAAFAVNVVGAENIARAAAAHGLPVIHVSTDYVFDGTKSSAYVETDPIAPLGVYGSTKAEGEARVRAANDRHFILRTSWVYGRFGANFLKTILRLARERDELRIVADQHGCPTATEDIAEAVFAIDRACTSGLDAAGTYHFAGLGATNWYGFARAIIAAQADITGCRPIVSPITTKDYPTPARRPANSKLNSSLFASVFGYRAQDWQSRTKATVKYLLNVSKEARVET